MGNLQKLGLINQEEARHEAELDEAKRAGRRNTIRRLRDAALDREQEREEATDVDLDEFEASLQEPDETVPNTADGGHDNPMNDDGTDLETDVDVEDQQSETDDHLELEGEPDGAAHTDSETEPASDDAADDETLTGSDEEA